MLFKSSIKVYVETEPECKKVKGFKQGEKTDFVKFVINNNMGTRVDVYAYGDPALYLKENVSINDVNNIYI